MRANKEEEEGEEEWGEEGGGETYLESAKDTSPSSSCELAMDSPSPSPPSP